MMAHVCRTGIGVPLEKPRSNSVVWCLSIMCKCKFDTSCRWIQLGCDCNTDGAGIPAGCREASQCHTSTTHWSRKLSLHHTKCVFTVPRNS